MVSLHTVLYTDLPEQYHGYSIASESSSVHPQRTPQQTTLYCHGSVPSAADIQTDDGMKMHRTK